MGFLFRFRFGFALQPAFGDCSGLDYFLHLFHLPVHIIPHYLNRPLCSGMISVAPNLKQCCHDSQQYGLDAASDEDNGGI